MTKSDFIKYWTTTAAKDWTAVKHMFKSKDYVHALFFTHLVLEKLCKAHWVKDNKGNQPPKIHNLIVIVKSTQLALSEEQLIFLALMNDFQLEGRYPDYHQKMYNRCNAAYTGHILEQAKSIRQWLLKNLQ